MTSRGLWKRLYSKARFYRADIFSGSDPYAGYENASSRFVVVLSGSPIAYDATKRGMKSAIADIEFCSDHGIL